MPAWTMIMMTLFVALILALLPMPEWTIWFRPAWVLLVLIYWTMTVPYRVNIGTAWVMGIIVDLLTGTLLGEHAFAYSLIIYFVSRMHIRLRMAPTLQQALSIFFFVAFYQLILYCIQGVIGNPPNSPLYWLQALTSVALWPWLFVLMRDCRRFSVA